MTADLESLRIDRETEPQGRKGVSPAWRYLALVLFLLCCGAGWYVVRELPPTGGTLVRVERVAAPDGRTETKGTGSGFTASGWVKLPLRYPVLVTPLVEGRVEEISVVEGDRVTEGKVIARLYEKDLRAALDAADARVAEAAATFAKLESGSRPQEISAAGREVEGYEAELENAREILEHSRRLHPTGAISLEELQRDESAVKVLAANLSRSRERLDLLEEGFRREEVDLAEASLKKAEAEREIARLQLEYARIESPIDGVVIERHASVGEWITPRTDAVVSLFDPNDLEVRVDVNQDDIAKVFPGQRVEISSRAQPGVAHPGRVVLIEPVADEIKNTVPVRVAIETPEGRLLYPDMVVKARFQPRESVDSDETRAPDSTETEAPSPAEITVPTGAVVAAGSAHHVFLIRDGHAWRREIVIGEPRAGRTPVLDGLHGGELLAVSGLAELSDGAPVRIDPED